MATLNYLVRGNSNPTNITLRFKHSDKLDITCTTGFEINPKYWNKGKGKVTNTSDVDLNNLQCNLDDLKNAIVKEFNNTEFHKIDRLWIVEQIKIFKGEKTKGQKRSDLVTDCIQYVIDTARIRANSKNGIGLSERRVKSYTTLLNRFNDYSPKARIKDVDAQFINDFKYQMIVVKEYAESYTNKLASDLITVCKDASSHGIAISNNLFSIKTTHTKNENIIYLDLNELEKIETLDIETDGLNNARKWLILGCNVGQRVSDLLNLSEKNIIYRNNLKTLEFTQKKTGKVISIPVAGKVEQILKEGFPYKITDQVFNRHIKTICQKAEINELTKGRASTGKHVKKTLGMHPKYKLIGSHVCRRSFASNYYGKMPLHLLKQITGHSTEKMLNNYLGKKSTDYTQDIADYYNAIQNKETAKTKTVKLKKIS